MLALFLLVVTMICVPAFPAIALLAGSGAVWAAKSWTGEAEDVIVMIFFYGALSGWLMQYLSLP